MPSINPPNILPSQPVTFLGPHAAIERNRGDIVQEWRGGSQVELLLLRAQNPLAAMFAGQKPDARLASLLDVAGIKAYPALINSTHQLDPDLPSPSQFDHVITAVPHGNGFVWLDTTAEVAPYGYLRSPLWGKQALVIPPGKAAAFVTTPAEPTTKAVETFNIEAKLKEDGVLEGKIERSLSGDDTEVLLRTAFRRVPMPRWKDLVQQVSYSSGFSGDVSDISVSAPEKTDEPFRLSYSYTRKDFPQWSERRVAVALPPMLAPAPDEKPTNPIWLGLVGEVRYESRMEIPKGYSPQLPAEVDLTESFADYHATYSVSDGTLQVERNLTLKRTEVPAQTGRLLNAFRGLGRFSRSKATNTLCHHVNVDNEKRDCETRTRRFLEHLIKE